MKNKNKLIAIVAAVLVVALAIVAVVISRGQQDQPVEPEVATLAPEITEAPAEEPTEEPAPEMTEEPVEEPVSAAAGEANGSDVLMVVNDQAVTRAEFEAYRDYVLNYYVQYFGVDATDEDIVATANGEALDICTEYVLLGQKTADLGLRLTDEERAQAEADNAEMWAQAVDQYAMYFGLTDESTEEEAANARMQALSLLEGYGYTESALLEETVENLEYEKIYAYMVQGVEVTDADIQAAFDEHVAADQAAYENDIGYYEFMTQYYGYPSYYTPAGYRGVTHILLEVDQELMNEWQSLTARLEEQLDEAEAEDVEAAETDEATQTDLAEVVTQAQVDAAKAAIIASVQATIDEIMQKLEEGTPFADLVAEYGTDPGMTEEPNKTEGYPVHMDSIIWDPAFVAGAFSVDEIGAVSEPVVGSYGVHIIQYTRDVPAGPVELTEELRSTLSDEALASKESQRYNETMDAWLAESEIAYSPEAEAMRALLEEAAE